MAKIYNKKINRNTNWGGDSSTGYLPVAGERVQEFIKDELNSKVGAFYKAPGSNFIYGFATVEDKNAYLLTEDESLILDKIEIDSNYTVYINQETLVLSKSVIEGTTGNTISFQFKITDKSGIVSDSRAVIEYSFLSAGNIKRYTTQVQIKSEGWTTVSSDVIDDYLNLGENTITISIQGLSTKTSSQFIMTYNIFNLKYETDFEYNIAQSNNAIEIPYTVSCSEIPINLEYYIDGNPVSSVESMVINEYNKTSRANIPINNLEIGKHTLQTRAYILASDGSRFYSNMYYYAFCKEGNTTPSFLIKKILSNAQSIIAEGEALTINLEQFEEFSMEWSLYDYRERKLTVNFEYDGNIILKPVFDTNGKINEFSFKPLSFGNGKILRIFAVDDNKETIFEDQIIFNVKESASGVKETTEGLLLKLSAVGKRNTDIDYNKWECSGSNNTIYYATFNNFNWNKQQGWNEDYEALVISDNAYVDFNIQPMLKNWATNGGGTFEIDLETFDIDDDNAVICECKTDIEGSASTYFRITATNAEFSTADGVKINTRYKDNEKLKIAFIGNPKGTGEDDNLIYIVVNGVLERAQIYGENDRIYSNAYLRIGNGVGGCKIRLRSIRVYNRAITVDEEFNNYVVDSPDSQILYEKNDVLNERTFNIDFDKVANKLPVMIFTGNMKELVDAGQDKNWRLFDVEYVNRKEPSRNFVAFNCQMKLQGTSSLGYPRKNFKLKTKNKDFDEKENYYLDDYEVDFTNTVEGNRRLLNKRTGQLMDFGELSTGCLMYISGGETESLGTPLHKGKYRFRANSHKATKWTLKADFMESSCSHNVGAGRSWNAIFEDTIFEPGSFAGYNNNTYQDEALVFTDEFETYEKDGVTYRIPRNTNDIKNQKKYVCRTDAQKICHAMNADDVRTAIDGFPMVCYYRTSHESNDLVFIGQYNFINDKGSYEVFGFEDIEDPEDESRMIYDASKVECWEGLKNANPISLFKTTDNWDDEKTGWKSTYEARYPDPEDYPSDASALYELSQWLVSTRHESDTVYSGTLNIDASFAKRINRYQYGYPEDNVNGAGYTYLDDNAESVNVVDNAENRQKKFEVEKWEHFDVWKLAGYYIYLMRYGAVDQFVKNTMLFTDGNGRYDARTDKKYRKWFFINYDNDCLFGLRNNGELAFHWDLDRQTLDGSADIIVDSGDTFTETNINTYAMMGHDSTLWNNLEADDEFMRMVRDLDNSMCSSGLTYENMVTEFDTKQTEMWCERIYNANERYKYIQAAKGIGDMEGKPVNNLWMLQGTRRSHRHWWIANHFNLLDAKWLSGKYRQTYMEIKTDCVSGDTIHAVAGTDYYFAWGLQKKIYESNIQKQENEAFDFVFTTNQVQGDPVYIYAINKMSELDFSDIAYKVAGGSFKFVIGDKEVANLLKKLVIGNPNVDNYATGIDTSTWALLNNLEYLDITKYRGIINLPFKSWTNLKTLKAIGSGLASFNPAQGSKFNLVELPDTITTIDLDNISFNDFANDFNYKPTLNLREIIIDNNKGVTNSYYDKLILPWITKINNSTTPITNYDQSILKVYHINWSFTNLEYVKIFENFKKYSQKDNFELKGKIDLTGCGALSMDDVEKIKEIFGENCFSETMSSIYIKTPETIFIHSDKEEMAAGKTNVFTREIYPDENVLPNDYDITYYLAASSETVTNYIDYANGQKYYRILDEDEIYELRHKDGRQLIHGVNAKDENNREIFELSVDEENVGQDTDVKVMAVLIIGDSIKISVCDFRIKEPTYAVTGTIEGDSSLYKNNEYVFTMVLKDANDLEPIGSETITWEVTGDDEEIKYINSTTVENNTFNLRITTNDNEPEISKSFNINATVLNGNGTSFNVTKRILALNSEVILTSETNPVVMNICNANGWSSGPSATALLRSEAESVEDIGENFAHINTTFSFNELKYFTGISELPYMAFYESKLTEITIPNNVQRINSLAFKNCNLLKKINSISSTGLLEENTLDNITYIDEQTFLNCVSLNKLILSDTIKEIKQFAFGNTNFTKALLGNENLANNVLILPHFVEKISEDAFETETWTAERTTNKLTVLTIPLTLKLTAGGYNLLNGKYYEEFIAERADEEVNSNYVTVDGILYDGRKTELIRYPAKKPRKYEEEIYSLTDLYNNSGYGIITLYRYAFAFVENIDEIEISNIVTSIGIHCFDGCNAKKIDLQSANNLNYIPTHAFNNCSHLEELTLPSGIKKIGAYAFNGCALIENLNIPDGVTELESVVENYNTVSKTFVGTGLHNLVLPESISKIGGYIVGNCNNLITVEFPEKLSFVNVGSVAYIYNCPNLLEIKCPISSYYDENENDIVINTNYNIAANCPKLERYIMSESNNGKHCFVYDDCIYSNTTLLAVPFGKGSISFKDTCDTIGKDSFAGNGQITTLIIPNTVTSIGENAFYDCKNLVSIEIPENVVRIDFRTFYKDNNLETIIFKGDIQNIGGQAFYGCKNLKNIYLCSTSAPLMPRQDLATVHPFGEDKNSYAGYDNRYTGENKIYIIKNAPGYTFDGDSNYNSWIHPVTDTEYCGFIFEDMAFTGEIILTVYKEGIPLSNEYIYIQSEYDEIGSGTARKLSGENGVYSLFVNKLYHGEKFEVYLDLEKTEKVGELYCDSFTNVYQIGEPIMSMGRGILLKSGSLDNSNESSNNIVLTQKEYNSIISQLNYLNDAIIFLKK